MFTNLCSNFKVGLEMFKKTSIKAIKESLSLLIIAAIIGTIVSFVAQLFIISAKNIYDFKNLPPGFQPMIFYLPCLTCFQ